MARSGIVERLWPIALEVQRLLLRFGFEPFRQQVLQWRAELPANKEDMSDDEEDFWQRKHRLVPFPLYPTLPEKFVLTSAAHDLCVEASSDSQRIDPWPDLPDLDPNDREQFALFLEGTQYTHLVREMCNTDRHPYGISPKDADRLETFLPELEAWLSDRQDTPSVAASKDFHPSDHATGGAEQTQVPSKKLRLDMTAGRLWVGNDSYDVTPNQAIILEALVNARGDWISVSEIAGVRSRDLNSLPPEVADLVERSRAKGCRLREGTDVA